MQREPNFEPTLRNESIVRLHTLLSRKEEVRIEFSQS